MTEAEFQIPSYPRGAVELLRLKGHTVTTRRNKHGSWRYSVDGKPETDALTMFKRFARYGL